MGRRTGRPHARRNACCSPDRVGAALLVALIYAYGVFNLSLHPEAWPLPDLHHLHLVTQGSSGGGGGGVWSSSSSSSSSSCLSLSRAELHAGHTLGSLEPLMAAEDCSAMALADLFYEAANHPVAVLLYQEALRRAHGQGTGGEAPSSSRNDITYHALLQLSRCYEALDVPDSAAHYALKAYNASGLRPTVNGGGVEPLYYLGRYYERRGDQEQALHFYALACQHLPQANQPLRVELERIDRELLWPRLFPPAYLDELAASEALLDNPQLSADTRAQVHWETIQRARPLLEGGQELFRREGPFGEGGRYYYATPSILAYGDDGDDHLILTRLINYHIDHGGRYYKDYLPKDDSSGVLRSSSALFLGHGAREGHELRVADGGFTRSPWKFMGTEDPRLFRMENGDVRVMWISWEYAKHVGEGSRMATGLLDLATFTVAVDHVFPSPCDRFLEKNWVMFQLPGGPLRFVYEWHPIKVGTFDDSSNTSTIRLDAQTVATPPSFKSVRGSANGVLHRGELWFLVHGTTWHKGPGPTYYHRMLVLDPGTLALKRYTYPFRLETAETPVEFSLGMTIDDQDRVTIAYSIWDASSVLRRIPLRKVEALMVASAAATAAAAAAAETRR